MQSRAVERRREENVSVLDAVGYFGSPLVGWWDANAGGGDRFTVYDFIAANGGPVGRRGVE